MNKEQFQLVSDIMKILSIKSFTHDEKGLRECQNFLIALAAKMDFQSSLHGKNRVLVIEPKNRIGVPELGIVVHTDTVPYDENQWKHNPLGEISNSHIYGRGIVDDKGPIILSMHALYNLRKEIGDSWQIIVGSSEEDEWIDMEEFLKENPVLPKFLVTIDGDGVLNGCRGYADLLLNFKRETNTRHITDFFVPNGMKNTVPAKAYAKIDGNLVLGMGKEVHSSIPEQGRSAITDLAKNTKNNLEQVYLEYSKMFDFLYELHTVCNESVIGLPVLTNEFRIGTSVSATTACMKEETIQINLNVRIGPGRTQADVDTAISYLRSRYGCDVELQKCIMPSYVDPNQKEFLAMCDAYNEVIGRKPIITIAKGLGYNAALPNCAIFGPRFDVQDDSEPDTCHQADESRSLENLFKFYDILKKFLKKVL